MKRMHNSLPKRNPLSPRGRGLRRLSERSELSRSWVRGLRREAHSARALLTARCTTLWRSASARTSRCATPHPTSAKLAAARQASVSFSLKGRRVISRAIILLLLATLAFAPAACGRKGAPVLPPGQTDQFPSKYPRSTDPQTGVFN